MNDWLASLLVVALFFAACAITAPDEEQLHEEQYRATMENIRQYVAEH